MGIISSNCKNKPSNFISLSATPPFSQIKSSSTDNLNLDLKKIVSSSNQDASSKLSHNHLKVNSTAVNYRSSSMNQSNSDNTKSLKLKKRDNNSKTITLTGNRLEIPSRINKSSSVSDIILLNNKDNVVQLTTGMLN